MDCVTPSNLIPIEPGYIQDIYQTISSVFGENPMRDIYGDELPGILEVDRSLGDEQINGKSLAMGDHTISYIEKQMAIPIKKRSDKEEVDVKVDSNIFPDHYTNRQTPINQQPDALITDPPLEQTAKPRRKSEGQNKKEKPSQTFEQI